MRLLTYIPDNCWEQFSGAAAVWLHYKPHWEATADGDAKLACFCTAPAIRSPLWNFFSEVVGTFILVLVATALFSKRVSPGGLARPWAGAGGRVGVGHWPIAGRVYGLRHHPARDLGRGLRMRYCRSIEAQGSDWSYAWVPVLGPLAGAALAAEVVNLLGMI